MGALDDDLEAAAQQEAEQVCAAVVREGIRDGHLVKWLGGNDIDASLVAVAALYDVFAIDHPVVVETVAVVESRLVDGGVHRYESDTFYGGGQSCLASLSPGTTPARATSNEPADSSTGWSPQQTTKGSCPSRCTDAGTRATHGVGGTMGTVCPSPALVPRHVPRCGRCLRRQGSTRAERSTYDC